MAHDSCRIDRATWGYGIVEGAGTSVVLVHGWGLSHNSYEQAATEIAAHGHKVVAPDLPGFGESSDLSFLDLSLEGYARALARFLEECPDLDGRPCWLVGHSFGGAVSSKLAHDRPELVAGVVLVSAVGGSTWMSGEAGERLLSDRPLWDWGYHLVSELPTSRFPRAALGVLADLSRNVVAHPLTLGLSAALIRRSNLTTELAALGATGVPVAAVWAEGDRVITKACFEDQCRALGIEGTVVAGSHGWPLSDPGSFGRTIGEILKTVEPKTTCAR
jgi:pimeloyl-ACP methyl ester carboxylesterase